LSLSFRFNAVSKWEVATALDGGEDRETDVAATTEEVGSKLAALLRFLFPGRILDPPSSSESWRFRDMALVGCVCNTLEAGAEVD